MNSVFTMGEQRQQPPLPAADAADLSPPGRSDEKSGGQQRLLGVLVPFGLACAMLVRQSVSIVDSDLYHELALARETMALGGVPLHDCFAYTPTVFPSVHHEWGAGVVAYALTLLAGAWGIMAAKFALMFALAAICWRNARRRGAGVGVLNYLALIAILLSDEGFATIRAQMYSFVFCALLLYWFDRDRRGERNWLWLWLPVFLVWLNVHAGFLLGAGLLAFHWLEQFVRGQPHRHLLGAGAAMACLVAVNPYGLHYYGYLWHAVAMSRPIIDEWAPMWHLTDPVNIVAFAISVAILLQIIWKQGFTKIPGLLLVVVTGIYSVMHQRMLPFYAIAWFSYVPAAYQPTDVGQAMQRVFAKRRGPIVAIWTALIAVFLVQIVTYRPWELRVPGERVAKVKQHVIYPVGAVEYLRKADFRGNLMTHYNHGSYVIWQLNPKVRVSMDGRYEVAYPPRLAEENVAFYDAREGWRETLDRYATDAVLVPSWSPVNASLEDPEADPCETAARWRRVYRDHQFCIFVRRSHPAAEAMPLVEAEGKAISGQFP